MEMCKLQMATLLSMYQIVSYASHASDFSLSCIETHTTASTDPHRTDRIISNAYMRTDDVIRNAHDVSDAGMWTLNLKNKN
ncbi:hypothetical protein SFRURICE_014092 [Spodoptera frugiperda]|nr:hypothetical protein SFRURICE_014092 [Spodoptera frugiperda]